MSILEPTPFSQDGRPLQMVIGTPGFLDTLHWVDQRLEEYIPDDEIEVEVKAIGMNQSDLIAAMGQSEERYLGLEFSGIVKKIGTTVTNFSIGDHVAGISHSQGVFATFVRTKATLSFRISNSISFEAAAGIPVAYATAQYGLIELGRLRKDERVLIHGANSASGQASICIAQMAGANVFATVSNLESKDQIRIKYGLREDQIYLSERSSFGPSVCLTTGSNRYDMVMCCTSADADTSREIWDSLSSFGRLVDVGTRGRTVRLETGYPNVNKSFMSGNVFLVAIHRPLIMGQILSEVSNFFRDAEIERLPTIKSYPISEAHNAFKMLQSGNDCGKVVVLASEGDEVKATLPAQGAKLLRPDASYILIGGTGGLGRSMARWMVSQGARTIVLVSRGTSPAKQTVRALIEEAKASGANIIVKPCDVSNSNSVQDLISSGLNDLPRVRGVVHGAMVLRDVLFEKMTFEEYTTVIESKVQGAWNFHNSLQGQQLDFFVAISSAAGAVGNRGQAAYSAANTFLNAFVQHRISLGLPASSLDLTAVSDVGYLSENAEAAAEVAKNLGSDTICEAEVLALLGAAVKGHLNDTCNNHTITGMRMTPTLPFWANDPKFKLLRLAAEAALGTGSGESAVVSYHVQLKAAETLDDAEDVVCRGLMSKLPSVLMLEAEDMDKTRSLSNYALDSLVAIEVRNYITREFEANLQVLELLSSGSIENLAKIICVKSKLVAF